ncbi:T9SS type A sorting domain-containing protein [Adhaeribacter radiodurans]|uniref:T9SS type A sorting domain-containing protein n=1 Tax=Adhaeribacter radiodurans TaxID=2745197 RepID=A0A7L7L8B5_9BACT|nr:T9SS type A sorting domain-containing protein [Adhaeribacter radiodurans]QMU28785.1 T9SS type A sorting domain-containing protein [Adhaeribacter radiodurans]
MKTPLSFLTIHEGFSNLKPAWFPVVFILLFFLLSILSSQAQNKVWDKTIGGKNEDKLSIVVATADGGYLLGGSSLSNKGEDKSEDSRDKKNYIPNNKGDYWVVKIDSKGQKIWDKTYGGDNSEELATIVASPDGGYLLGGSSHSGKSGDKSESNKGTLDEYGYIPADFWIVKIDANGKKIWDKTIGGDDDDELSSIVATLDGGYLMGGLSETGKNGDKSEPSRGISDFWLVKIKADGSKVWDKRFGGSNIDWLSALLATPDGGYLLGGRCDSHKSGDKSEEKSGYWVIKIDATGKKLWDKTLSGGYNLTRLLATADGGYLLGSSAGSGKNEDKSTSYAGYWIVKLKANGEKVWDKSYGGSTYDMFADIVSTPDGGYLLAGTSNRKKGGDKSEDKNGYWLIKIKENGAKVWEKTFGSVEGIWNSFQLGSLVTNKDKGYLLGGTSFLGISGDKSEASRGSYDFWALKIEDVTDINKKRQTITIPTPLITKSLGDSPFILSAQASSGLPVTFKLVSGPAILKNNNLTVTGVGKVIVKATQSGNATYAAAPEVTQTILVDPSSPVTKLWDKRYGGKTYDKLVSMVATPDGGYLLAGDSNSGKEDDKSDATSGYWLVKIDKNGKKIWDVTLSVLGDLGNSLSSMIVTPDGGYLLGGSAYFDFSNVYWVVKISSNGTKQWEKSFASSDNNYLGALVTTPDGGYLLGGESGTAVAGDGYDYWVVKIDAKGNQVWDKHYGGNDYDFLSTLLVTSDGGYLLGGSSSSGKGKDKSEPNKGGLDEYGSPSTDYWLVKIDAQGKKIWDKTLGGDKSDGISEIKAFPDGGYLVAGSSNSGKSGDKSQVNKGVPDVNGYSTSDFWLVKIDSQGKKVWDKTIGGNASDGLATVVATVDGGFLLGGSSSSGIGEDKTGEYRGGQNSGDYWVVKIDNSGKKLWDKTLGGDNIDKLSALIVSREGYYLLGGISYSGATGDKSEPTRDTGPTLKGDFWVVQLKEELPLAAEWDFRYGGSSNEGFTSIIKTTDGGYLSGGYSASRVSGDKSQVSQGKNDYWIVKSDQNGKKLWDKRYGGTSDDYLNRIIPTKDGGYLLAGSSLSGKGGDKTEVNKGDRDYWLVKIDKQGNKEWDKSYGGSGSDELKKVLQLSTGEYILAGYSNSPVSGDKTQASQGGDDYWLVKISSKGEKLWNQRYGGNLEEMLGGIVQTSDGGYLLGGSSWSGKSGNKTEGSRGKSDFWLVAVDKEGKQLWDKTYGGTGEDEAYSVGKAGTTYFLAGQSNSPAGLDKTRDSQGGLDYWLLKVTSTGEKVWDKRYGGEKDDELRASIPTQDGGYLLAGKSFSNKSGNKRQDSQGSSDYWIVKADKEGQYEWSKTFGGSGAEELRAVIQTQDGGFLLAGKSDSGVSGDRTQPSQGGSDYWLVKVIPEANPIVAERETMLVTEPVVETELSSLTVYPNPAQEQVTVRFTLPETQAATVKVYDSQGRETAILFQGQAQANQTYQLQWQANNLLAGMYLLQLHSSYKNHTVKLLLHR